MGTAMVVGGTSGIGLATAYRLRDQGHRVHVVARHPVPLDGVSVHGADGGVASEIAAVARSVAPIDWLIITLSGREGPGAIADLDLTMLRRAFDAKFWAHVTTIQAALPHLRSDGSITLLGAITARAGMPGTAGIGALNGAVEALVKPLAVELAPIRVNAVSPGFVDTPWWRDLPSEAREAYFAQAAKVLPVGRIATADDVADVVVLAATNPNLTGSVLEADGGARLVSI
jgi:NAD(P)-dependent dehydrogenase (short-subunit alcohol dehydrogenase family)